jgi:hypothetical protein
MKRSIKGTPDTAKRQQDQTDQLFSVKIMHFLIIF